MLARVRKLGFRRGAVFILLVSVVGALSSCASKPPPQLVSDGVTGRESAIPWNQQQRWENTGQLGGLADQMQTR